ncbi:MAG: glycosyltransferase involved in cell wall biosynthesis [bacterium]
MNTKSKVLHFIDSDGLYGAESVILNLSMQMKSGSGYIPVIGCIVSNTNEQNDLYDRSIELGLEVIKVVIANSKLLWEIPKAAKQIKNLNIDVIHSHGYKPSVYGFLISKLISISIIATCHLWFEIENKPLKMKVLVKLELYFYQWFSQIIAVSEQIKSILVENGLDAGTIKVVANGVNIEEVANKDKIRLEVRKQLNISSDKFVILNSGRLTKQKAQWMLVEAAKKLKDNNENFITIIVGEGELFSDLTVMINDYGLKEHVKLLGFCSNMKQLLIMADCFALPSIDEGMPMSLLEAAAYELPIISTDVGDITKLIIHNETGHIISVNTPENLANSIITFSQDQNLSHNFAKNAKKRMYEIYSSVAMCNSYYTIYNDTLNRK